ncbi:MAG: hypothetical protein LUC88_06720 [Prevotella sp.]|nr:hypothetical protein [Prevotella sp.]
MKRILFFSVLILCSISVTVFAQEHVNQNQIANDLNAIKSSQVKMEESLRQLSETTSRNSKDIQDLTIEKENLCKTIDSLKAICDALQAVQKSDVSNINGQIKDTNDKVESNQSVLEKRSLWVCIIAIVIIISILIIYWYFISRIKRGSSSIDEVRRAQDALQSAQTKMQEESVKLDNKLIELIEGQISSTSGGDKPDHSLALKVADEIVRIEANLSRMDASIKGYKQLTKAVQRIKDNFNANGYEIVDMLGKPYNAGMKVIATFVTDENLEEGQQIITRIIKPQINYKQQMIQVAQIEVSQPE